MKINTFTKGNKDSSCEHHLTFKDENNFQIKINTFTKGNKDSSCEHHTTIKQQNSTYETSMNSKLFTNGNENLHANSI